MSKVKVLIVEDEAIIADDIFEILEDFGYEVIAPTGEYDEAISVIEQHQPDIAILDINLGEGKSGIDLAQKINSEHNFPFIFLTSNTDKLTVSEAKSVEPFAYLMKPFRAEELYTSIEVALYNFAKQKERAFSSHNLIIKDALFIRDKRAFNRLNFSDILYIKSDRVYIEIIQKGQKKLIVRGNLNEYINKLPITFFRIHRSYIVNLDYLETVNGNRIILAGTDIPVGQNQKEELLSQLNKG